MPNHRVKIQIGETFGDWTVIQFAEDYKSDHIRVECRCVCGRTALVGSSILKNGRSKGCGCTRNKIVSKRNTKHGYARHPLYPLWNSMMQRCYNQKNKSFSRYGGRGIVVCERWHTFENFLADMCKKPSDMSIERKDNNGNYCPDNCTWASKKRQCNNRSTNLLIVMDGETKTLQEWADLCGISRHTIQGRLKRGWSIEKAISNPLDPRGGRKC